MIAKLNNRTLTAYSGSSMLGEIIMYMGTIIPEGYLPCFNQEVSRETYADLYSYAVNLGQIGPDRNTYLFGPGNGQTTFNLPDFRECVIVGASLNNTQNSIYSITTHDVYKIGQFKDDQFQTHRHWYVCAKDGSDSSDANTNDKPMVYNKHSSNTTGQSGKTGNVTRGKQAGIIYLIRYVKSANQYF